MDYNYLLPLLLSASLLRGTFATHHNILQIAPNFLDDHFTMNAQMANLLAEDDHTVYFLIPLSNPEAKQSSLAQLNTSHANMRVEFCTLTAQTMDWIRHTPDDKQFMDPPPESVQGNWWTFRHLRQSPAIAYVESFMVIRDIAIQPDCLRPLIQTHRTHPFTVGLVDVWDAGALALFHHLGIQHTVLLQSFPIMSHLYDYMTEARWAYDEQGHFKDYKRQLVENGVPEVLSTRLGGAKNYEIEKDYKESADIFETVYNLADDQFKLIFEDKNFPKLRNLIMEAKYLFVNSRSALNYELGQLPKRVKFIGGIQVPMQPQALDPQDDGKLSSIFALDHPVILFSIGTLLSANTMPEHKFEALVRAFGQMAPIQIIWRYDTKALKGQRGRRDLLAKVAPNVHMVYTVNEQAILVHPRTVLFISHCGNTPLLMDAVHAGVPLVCMPLFAYHFYTASVLARKGAALVLDHYDARAFTADVIRTSIEAAVRNNKSKFRSAINKLQEELHEEHIVPQKLFLEAIQQLPIDANVSCSQSVKPKL